MANHKQAIKRHRQNEINRQRNVHVRTKVKSTIKVVREAVKTGDKNVAAEALVKAVKTIDIAASKGVLHRKNASRKISRLTKTVNTIA